MFGRETIQQVGLLCIIVAFPIAELPQSLVSTSVSFTDTYTLSVVQALHNLMRRLFREPRPTRLLLRTKVCELGHTPFGECTLGRKGQTECLVFSRQHRGVPCGVC